MLFVLRAKRFVYGFKFIFCKSGFTKHNQTHMLPGTTNFTSKPGAASAFVSKFIRNL